MSNMDIDSLPLSCLCNVDKRLASIWGTPASETNLILPSQVWIEVLESVLRQRKLRMVANCLCLSEKLSSSLWRVPEIFYWLRRYAIYSLMLTAPRSGLAAQNVVCKQLTKK
jgi:hypothetical protein